MPGLSRVGASRPRFCSSSALDVVAMACRTYLGIAVIDRFAIFDACSKAGKVPAGPDSGRLLEAVVRYALSIPPGDLYCMVSNVVVRACS